MKVQDPTPGVLLGKILKAMNTVGNILIGFISIYVGYKLLSLETILSINIVFLFFICLLFLFSIKVIKKIYSLIVLHVSLTLIVKANKKIKDI